MKYLLLFSVLLSAQKECNTKGDLRFIRATSQNWSGGAAATHGTYYKIYFLKQETIDLQFDSLWVNDKRLPVSQIKSNTLTDTILIMANDYQGIRNPMNQTDISNSVPSKFPIETNAAGVLGYFTK